MNTVQRSMIVLLAAVAAGVVGWRIVVWRGAAVEHARAAAERTALSEKSTRIAALRAQPAVNGFGAKPAEDVMPLANRVLEAAHLPAARLRTVQPEADRTISDDRDGRRASTVRLSLEPLTVQELGAFLSAWRSSQQVWSVSRIDLSAMTVGGAAGGAIAGNYRASITVSATYIDELPAAVPAALPAAGSAGSSSNGFPLLGRTP